MKYNNNKKRFFSCFVLFFISMMCFAQTTPIQKFHDTKGNIDVNGAGQLQFTLPIALPPGIKSVAPQVNLVYNNGASNGIAGYGWNISATSSISRTGKNIEKDGEVKGVQLDYTDYYSFNGQRLILKSGEYGKDGAEYVTEKYSNVKIKSVGSVSGQSWQGPEYWEVTSPDGSQAWYGATSSGNSDARTPLEYNIVKSKDSQGNYITYNYTQDTGTNVAVISSIKWGGNEPLGKTHFNEIVFNYNVNVTRGLTEQSYMNGISFIQDKLLNNIVVNTNTFQYRKYDIIYKSDDTKYQFVEKIQEYNSENQPANPIEFFRTENNPNYTHVNTGGWTNFYELTLSGDFRGTHATDFIIYKKVSAGNPEGYYLHYGGNEPGYYLGPENVYKGAVSINIKDANNFVSSKQGFVSYSINPTTKDLTLNYYLIDLTKRINYSTGSFPNALYLVGTKVIARNQWDESESNFPPDIYYSHQKTSNIVKLIPYDIEGDGIPEVLIAKNNSIRDKTCPHVEGQIPQEDECEITTYEENKYIVVKQQDSSFPFFQFEFYKNENLLFGDFNGDGIDDIGRSNFYSNTTINGESVPGNMLQAYNLKKNDQGNYGLSEVFSGRYSGLSSEVQMGDFNGDGISDLFVRTNINNHYIINLNTGKSFLEIPYFNDFNGTESNTSDKNGYYYTAKVLDINADGKSDIIDFSTSYSITTPTSANTSLTIKVNENQGYLNGRIQFGFIPPVTNTYDAPYIFRDILGLRQNELHIYTPTYNQNLGRVTNFLHYSNLPNSSINKIVQGEVTNLITYGGTNPYYKPVKNEQYPLMELGDVNSQLVSAISNNSRFKKFRYRGLIINLHNKKTIGFRQLASSSWYGSGFENTIIWSGTEVDPWNEGVPVKEWSIRTNDETKIFPADISENNTELLSFKSTTYQTDKLLNSQIVTTVPDAEKAKVVTAIVPKTSKAKNFLTGAIAESAITYGEYYLPTQSVSKINSSLSVTTSTFEYNNNPSGLGADYYVGRSKSKTEVIKAYGDTKSGKEEYTYENNRIKTIKKWNENNTGHILDTYSYDGFGNLTQKVSSNSIDPQTITSGFEYDSKGRFIIKQTDNLGLQIETTYNDWGQIITKTDPLGNTLTNTYDGWGKLLTSTTNLDGTTTYNYERDSDANITIIQSDPDGNVSKIFTNKLGQEYKTSTKAFGQGQFVSKETLYDVLGRKIKESEPYFEGQSASQWNIIAYDDSVYPAKVTATLFNGKQTETTVSGLTTTVKESSPADYGRTTSKTADALGNIISSKDSGGTLKFNYNAAGQQIMASYEDNIVRTKYDSWGRKSEFNDPSNGIYKYEYNGLGQPKRTISPKGTKEYTYNSLGQLASQKEFSTIDGGQTTNKKISFGYTNKGMLSGKAVIINGQTFNTTFTYDPQGRLLSSAESSYGKTYTQKGIAYDDKGRVVSYEKELQSSGVLTKVTVENVYNPWNGQLYQIKDKNSGKILWELKDVNAKGLLLKEILGATAVNNTYDANGLLTNVNHSSQAMTDILDVSYSFDAIRNELKTRKTRGDFDIAESFDYDSNNRLINWTDPVTGIKPTDKRNGYDKKGRIIENDQVGTMKYENSAKIYQPTGMTLNAAGIQNYNGDLIQTVVYNENNDPVFIDGAKGDVAFQYGFSDMRQKVSYGGNFDTKGEGKFTKFYNEDGSFEVVKDNKTAREKHILYIGGNPYESNIVYLKDFDQTVGSYKFLHKDYIGSILAISDEAGNKLEQRHYDAWGSLVALSFGNHGEVIMDKNKIDNSALLIDRGYTSHEHFAEVGIIHMNGRLYDPLLRRFLNADENIQDPMNTQNYNKYGYVMNNPLMYNDPSGEFLGWLIGAIVGSYLSGVQANHGNWNPVKWDWQNTWTSVIGGAFAGAALGQGISNISVYGTKFIQNSVVGAVGSIFNGLANGQNIFKSALTGFAGINYSFNLSGNRMTSTDLDFAGYKYSISEMLVSDENTLIGGTEAEFSRDTVLKVANAHYENQFIRGSWHFVDETSDLSPYLRGQGYSFGGSSNRNLLVNGDNKVWGLTEIVTHNDVIVWQRIYLPKGAFISLEQLDLTMGHEIFHSILNNARLFDQQGGWLNRKDSVHEYFTGQWEQQYVRFRGWQKLNLSMQSLFNYVTTDDSLKPLIQKIRPIFNNYLKSTLK
ncbi:FG-GAP-like repeat-containing protein [Chryseobacterium sp. WG23]|uniref:RHS repeat-associated core domain-containing protein n=1 Tax=Chryseobacterium sp. WG23 TaxID=2926910 RepID=UPI00211F1791|nr:RHS repeat-associated core domain-containing protein [Chryseobacterium sp. WG23]MCQ9633844.1 FG-GAP-like repeat-containing protein [Chryseobacterium sp. WG23]